jgi:hypothetical protein
LRLATKSVSFQSPRSRIAQPLLLPTKSLPAVPSRRERSLSPPSQDSFGGAVSQDPAANYVAQATQLFEVPLSDLGRTANDLAMDGRLAHSAKPHEDGNDSWMDKIRRAYQETKSAEASGSVLVEASQSDGSQDSSKDISFPHPDASQLLNDGEVFGFIDIPPPHHSPIDAEESPETLEAQRDRYASQGDASQSSLLTAEDESLLEKNPMAIPEELAPTQPSTPMDNTLAEDDYVQTLRSRSARATAGTISTATPGPRSLLSLVHPDRARRLQQLHGSDITAQAPPASRDAARRPPVQTSYYAETQPSTLVTHPSDLVSEDVPVPIGHRPKQPASLHRPQLPQPRARSIAQGSDNLDIVPDSEPPAPSNATPARVLQNATKRPFRPLSPMSEHGSGEIVADSMEVPESSQDLEGDIPLATLLQIKSAKPTAEPAPGKMRSSRKPPSFPPPPVPVKKVIDP